MCVYRASNDVIRAMQRFEQKKSIIEESGVTKMSKSDMNKEKERVHREYREAGEPSYSDYDDDEDDEYDY